MNNTASGAAILSYVLLVTLIGFVTFTVVELLSDNSAEHFCDTGYALGLQREELLNLSGTTIQDSATWDSIRKCCAKTTVLDACSEHPLVPSTCTDDTVCEE